jgi:flagellar biosynthesis protein FlhG
MSGLVKPIRDIKTPENNLLAVASGKGGVGKTWLSVTLASAIARAGRRVLLFDSDLGLANVDIQLGLTPTRDLGSFISGRCSLRETITNYSKGLDIIAGRSGSGSLANLSRGQLQGIIDELVKIATDYDIAIMDLGAGVEEHVRFMAAACGRCLVVVTDEPTSLTDAYAFIKIMHSTDNVPNIEIVVNQATTQKDADKTYETISKACENFLGITPPLAGTIRKDNKVKDAIRSQTSVVVKYPNCTAATDAAAMAVKLLARK